MPLLAAHRRLPAMSAAFATPVLPHVHKSPVVDHKIPFVHHKIPLVHHKIPFRRPQDAAVISLPSRQNHRVSLAMPSALFRRLQARVLAPRMQANDHGSEMAKRPSDGEGDPFLTVKKIKYATHVPVGVQANLENMYVGQPPELEVAPISLAPACWWDVLPDVIQGDIFEAIASDYVDVCAVACVSKDFNRVYSDRVTEVVLLHPERALHGMWGGGSAASTLLAPPGPTERALLQLLRSSSTPRRDTGYICDALAPSQWLNDLAIDEYLATYFSSATTLTKPEKIVVVKSCLLNMEVDDWWTQPRAMGLWHPEDHLEGAATALSAMLDSRVLLFPLCMGNHWRLLVRRRRTSSRCKAHWLVFDSLGGGRVVEGGATGQSRGVQQAVLIMEMWLRAAYDYLLPKVGAAHRLQEQEHLLHYTTNVHIVKCDQQLDGTSCGVYVLAYARCIASGCCPYQIACRDWREHIAIILAVRHMGGASGARVSVYSS